jgi:hypothetical protein
MARPSPRCFGRSNLAPLGLAFLALAAPLAPVRAQQTGYGQTLGTSPQERQMYDGSSPGKQNSILDATNPIDLMNRIRRSTALDDATPPGTAIDQALREFDSQSAPAAGGASGPTQTLKGP